MHSLYRYVTVLHKRVRGLSRLSDDDVEEGGVGVGDSEPKVSVCKD